MQREKYISKLCEAAYGRFSSVFSSFVNLNDKQIKQYRTHGLAEIQCEFPNSSDSAAYEHFFIDAYPLQSIAPPKSAWFSKISPDCLKVIVSSGKKQHVSHKATRLDSGRILEGLEIRFNYKDRINEEILFTVDLVPLYGDLSIKQDL
jgi:hypothetical protein